jgi:hypothetical protein
MLCPGKKSNGCNAAILQIVPVGLRLTRHTPECGRPGRRFCVRSGHTTYASSDDGGFDVG